VQQGLEDEVEVGAEGEEEEEDGTDEGQAGDGHLGDDGQQGFQVSDHFGLTNCCSRRDQMFGKRVAKF